MQDESDSNNKSILQNIFLYLLSIGSLAILSGLFLIPSIIKADYYWFTIGGYSFIFGVTCMLLAGLIIMIGAAFKSF